MVEPISQSKMQQNIVEFERLLEEFELMFMNIPGDLDFSKLKSLDEIKSEVETRAEETKEDKRRQSAVIKFEVCD